MEPSKKDWKLFIEKLPGWQESHMEKLVMEYKEFLNEDIPASTKFWELEKKIKLDKKQPGVILERSKRNMVIDIIRLLNDKVITMNDLLDFSDDLRENIIFLKNRI